jgi:hypothetical protein
MTAKAKTVNYTPEMTAALVKDYTAGVSVQTIADNVGRSVRSVVAKLSREGVYKAKEYVSKTGEKPVKKDTFADDIASLIGLTESEAESLTKANKTALKKILDRMASDAVVIEELKANAPFVSMDEFDK